MESGVRGEAMILAITFVTDLLSNGAGTAETLSTPASVKVEIRM
jgi:hypothetical protein